jgi:hypothetical protein
MGVNLGLSLRRKSTRLRVFEKRLLRIFRPKREEVVGGWRRLHTEELRNFHTSLNIIKEINEGG